MKDIFLFDIDDCIMKSVFPNFQEAKGVSRELIVKTVRERGKLVILYPEFVKFYQKWGKQATEVYFITGRKNSDFGFLTESQLEPIRKYKVYITIFYPKKRQHLEHLYFNWKVNTIKKKIKQNAGKDVIIWIFDDLIEHFPKIQKIADEFKVIIQLIHIDNKDKWFYYHNEFKNIKAKLLYDKNTDDIFNKAMEKLPNLKKGENN